MEKYNNNNISYRTRITRLNVVGHLRFEFEIILNDKQTKKTKQSHCYCDGAQTPPEIFKRQNTHPFKVIPPIGRH